MNENFVSGQEYIFLDQFFPSLNRNCPNFLYFNVKLVIWSRFFKNKCNHKVIKKYCKNCKSFNKIFDEKRRDI